LNGGSNGVAAYIDSTVILKGPGTVEMDFTSYSIRGGLSNGTLDNQTTIEGQGTIGTGDTPLPGVLTLINSGTIEAVGGEFVINTGTRNSATTTNSGTLEANGANAVLLIHHTNMNNAGGTIAALNGGDGVSATASVVELLDDVIVGGTLKTSNYGIIETIASGSAPTITVFDGVTNQGYVYVNFNTILTLRDTIDNTDGTIALSAVGGATLLIDGTVNLEGGSVQLNSFGNGIVAAAAGAKLENTSTIYGPGNIGFGGGELTFDNKVGGVVDVNTLGILVIHTGNTVTNAGTLEATNEGELTIEDIVDNTGGLIAASGARSVVHLGDATVRHGDLKTDTGGVIDTFGGHGTFDSLTIDSGSNVEVLGATSLTLENTIENDGAVTVDAGVYSGTVVIAGTVSLTGSGAIVLDGSGADIVGLASGTNTLDNASIIEGAGQIGAGDGHLTLDNQSGGVVNADVNGAALTINTGANQVANRGTLEATNGGILTIVSDFINCGQVQVIGSGRVFIESNSVTNAIDGTITADGSNEAQLVIDCNSDSTVYDHGTFLNYGTVTSSNRGDIAIDSAIVTNEAGATITSEGVSSVFFGVVGNGAGTTTFGTLSNFGAITADASYIGIETPTITNEAGGTITAHGATAEIDIDDRATASGDTLSNSGAITACDGGVIHFESTAVTNACGGILLADGAGSELLFAGGTVTNHGLVEATDGGRLDIDSAVYNAGTLMADGAGSVLDIACTSSLCGPGSILIENGGTAVLQTAVAEEVTFSGTGTDTLQLDCPSNFCGTIAGMSPTLGVIDLKGFNADGTTATPETYCNGITTLLVSEDGQSVTLKLDGDYVGDKFNVASDHSGGVDVTDAGLPPVEWINTNGGSWTNADDAGANWSTGTIPTGGDTVMIDVTSANDYTVTIPCDASVTVDSLTLSTFSGKLLEQGTLSVSGSLTLNAGIVDMSGNITVGSFAQGEGSLTGSGVLTVTGAANFDLSSGFLTDGFEFGTGETILQGTTTYSGLLFVEGGWEIQNQGAMTWLGGSIELGSSFSETGGTFDNASNGTIRVEGDGSADAIVNTALFSNEGTITIAEPSSDFFEFGTAFRNNGTVNIESGTLTIAGPLSGGGSIDIGSGTELTMSGGAATSTGTITFEGEEDKLTLYSSVLNESHQFTPTLSGFNSTDEIDVQGTVTNAVYNGSNGVLTLFDGASAIAYLTIGSGYGGDTFTATSGGGFSQIVDPVATTATIANGATLDINAAPYENVSFAGPTGTLVLERPSSFQGQIVGPLASGDVIDVKGFDATHTSVAVNFNAISDTTMVTVTDALDHQSVTLTLDGNDSSSAFTVASDGKGGVDIADTATTSGASIDGLTLHVPSPTPPAVISGDGPYTIAGATLTLDAPSSQFVSFAHGTLGGLVLEQPNSFTGTISGFTGTAPDAAHSDTIDLVGVNYNSAHFSETYDASKGVLTVTDGSDAAHLSFAGFNGKFDFASDGNGGTLITDPMAAAGASTETASGSTVMLTTGSNPASAHIQLSSLLKVLTTDQGNAATTDIVDGGHATGQAPGTPTTSGGDHTVGPIPATMSTLASPAFASASLGGLGSDSFAFHPNLGNDTAQNTGAPASELAHNNIQVSGPALGSTAPEFHAEFALDVIHQDDSHLAATVDQFHQMAANSTLLH
jgi:hypothetical protein